MRTRRSGPAVVVSALALCLAAGAPAWADEASTTPDANTTTVSGADADHDATALTDEEVQRQVARAEALREEIIAGDAAMEKALTALDKASDKANAALEAFSTADEEARGAQAKADQHREIAKALQKRLDEARNDLKEWAVSAYTEGGNLAEQLGYLDALTKDAADVSVPLSDLNYLTDNRIRSVEQMREVAVQEKLSSMTADLEETKATTARAKAKKARDEADALVKEQKTHIDTLRKAHQKRVAEAGPLVGLLLGSGDADAESASQRLADALEEIEIAPGAVIFEPCSEADGTYPNGQIPPAALCPMVGSTDEFLPPAAAAAFNAMSKAYAEETGHLLCVTDGYRSYAEQVAVKAARGMWAAKPGTSNHGYGKAVDLCGGVNNYADPAHLWMKQNAALYGWYHPSWAQQGGSLPEPWHWEFAGIDDL